MNTLEQVKEIIANVCEVPVSEITETNTVGDFPSWDSIGHLTILSTIEETFNISFEPEEMMELEDVSDIVKSVESKL